MIGAGVRVKGNIAFTGVLRIQGEVLGDVSCSADSNGTVVVGKSGNVTGTIRAPHIVVNGGIHGPLHSSESIEIQQGAHVVGDAFYKAIDIHAGGIIEGSLAPESLSEGTQPEPADEVLQPRPPAAEGHPVPPGKELPAGSRFRGRWLGGAVVLFIGLLVVLANREPTTAAPPAAALALKPDSAAKEGPEQSAPAASEGPRDGPAGPGGNPGTLVRGADADAKKPVPAPAPDLAEMDPKTVVTVPGVNPGKPAGVISVVSKDAAVLFRKKRQDPGEGTRIDISQGATESIAIARNEIFRVAKGRDLTIFYQGRKVTPKTIDSGAWMSFVPQSADGAGDRK